MPRLPVRFIHAADLCLDSAPAGVGELSDEDRRVAEDATLTAFSRLTEACLEHDVELLLVSGPVFAEERPTLRAAAAVRTGTAILAEYGIAVVAAGAAGTGGAAGWSAMSADGKSGPPGSTAVLRDVGVYEHRRDGRLIATIVSGEPPGGEPEAFGYAALAAGPRRREERGEWVLHHPGPLVGLWPRSVGPHGATLVEVTADGGARLQPLPFAPLRRERCLIGIDPHATREELIERMQLALLERTRMPGEELWLVDWIAVGEGVLFEALRQPAVRSGVLSEVDRVVMPGNGPRLRHRIELRSRTEAASDRLVKRCLELIDGGTEELDVGALVGAGDGPQWDVLVRSAAERADRRGVSDRAARLVREWMGENSMRSRGL